MEILLSPQSNIRRVRAHNYNLPIREEIGADMRIIILALILLILLWNTSTAIGVVGALLLIFFIPIALMLRCLVVLFIIGTVAQHLDK